MLNKYKKYILIVVFIIKINNIYGQNNTDSLSFIWSESTINDSLLDFNGIENSLIKDSIFFNVAELFFLDFINVKNCSVLKVDTSYCNAKLLMNKGNIQIRIKFNSIENLIKHYKTVIYSIKNISTTDKVEYYCLDTLETVRSRGESWPNFLHNSHDVFVYIDFPFMRTKSLISSGIIGSEMYNPELVLEYIKF